MSDGPAPAPRERTWRRWAGVAKAAGARTPFFLFSPEPIAFRAAELEWRLRDLPARLWYSFKTLPCAPALRWWKRGGGPVEVVSEFEFRAARAEGFGVDDILVNGPAKHRWLPAVAAPGLRVNFDGPGELAALLPLARRFRWRTGLRVRTREEFNPGHPGEPAQFGFSLAEAAEAWRRLESKRLAPDALHFHLRTNVADAAAYGRALEDILELCADGRIQPRILDVGGGLPAAGPLSPEGAPFDGAMDLDELAGVLRRALDRLPSVNALWLEPGRRIFAGCGALVVTVLDVKAAGDLRQLICDGGRTLHAMPSVWEDHALAPLRRSRAPLAQTAVHGPTCMAYDRLALRRLPNDLRAGDRLLWLDAGAYHLSWETRFSHGLAAVWWMEGDRAECVRPAETFEESWSRWTPPAAG